MTYVVIGAFAVVFLTLAVINTIDAREPVIWGTFTEEYCQETRRGCSSIGTWVSDDQTITKTDIRLDGWVEPGGSISAGYQPTGIISDADNHIVHAVGWMSIGPHLTWVAAMAAVIWGLVKAFQWGHLSVPRIAVSAWKKWRHSS
ncbi:hypothetical protein [Agromyces bracchium]|uniref:DUF3592 domain-containing protein n=1 Tax=Agromyces bracchium TaxID=88376 RepID=A0A6I3M1W8_9MICO|nr:hypothetical protein [Agromyces bracchium]MTH66888.1 hypothetical protein [Agromyces bracchium]